MTDLLRSLTAATIATLVLWYHPSMADSVPRYDPADYCRNLASLVGESKQARMGCLESQSDAYAQLKDEWTAFPPSTTAYCGEVAEVAGGSYPILMACIEREMDASLPPRQPGF